LSKIANVGIMSDGVNHTVIVNGQDISKFLRNAIVRLDANEPVELELEFAPQTSLFRGRAKIVIEDDLAKFLVGLGWTPPDG